MARRRKAKADPLLLDPVGKVRTRVAAEIDAMPPHELDEVAVGLIVDHMIANGGVQESDFLRAQIPREAVSYTHLVGFSPRIQVHRCSMKACGDARALRRSLTAR